MVEPLFRIEARQRISVGDLVVLDGPEGKHAVSVRRMRVGEAIQLTDGCGLRIRGVVASIADKSLSVEVGEINQEPEPDTKLTLVQALAKGDRDELAIQAATELGAWQIVPWQADRSVSRWEGVKILKGVERWQSIVSEAAKQSLRAFEPKVSQPLSSKQLQAAIAEYDAVLLLDPTASRGIGQIEVLQGNVAIVVGPEGGISDAELASFESAGAVRIRLGSEILRTSTAGIAAISALQTRLGAWN